MLRAWRYRKDPDKFASPVAANCTAILIETMRREGYELGVQTK
jgi:predicted membrane GTPase involved in stress response